jgi:ArsR family transcriptional regulator, arsenate/arsenite/antimonite-responsive transcriptional repressor
LPFAETVDGADPLPRLMKMFRLLADETRLRILHLLLDANEYHVRALCEHLGQSQPAVSHHLALLRSAGLIECRRQGKHNFYHLRPQKLEEMLDVVFADKRPENRQIRVGKYALSRDE